jgi:FKBP-type peptidyl-prolyl cis-trans isomerase
MRKTIGLITTVLFIVALALAQEKMTSTASGLQYRDVTVGSGEVAMKGNTVQVRYTGWLFVDGKRGMKFDSSEDSKWNGTFKLGKGEVMAGWDEGIEGMRVGGKRELIVPPKLAYGPKDAGGVIPANSTLDFEVELMKVTK